MSGSSTIRDTAGGAASRAERIDVRSHDGTRLAVWVDGDGPPLVMVHGSLNDHTAFAPLIGELRGSVTTFAMDRRGFGASDDAPVYAIEREFEDVAAVVEAVAARTGTPVTLWGHSYGASCAMGGAARTRALAGVVLYEPSLGLPYPAGSIAAIEAAVAAGDTESALREVLVGVAGMTPDEFEAVRAADTWSARLATAPTIARECRAEEGWVWTPGQFDAVAAPVVLLAGADSPPDLVEATQRAAAALPDARIHRLEGHGHFAHRTHPGLVAGVVTDFMRR